MDFWILITTIILCIYLTKFTSTISLQITSCDCCHTYHNISAIRGDWKIIISSVYEESNFWNLTSCTKYSEKPNVEFDLPSTQTRNFGYQQTKNSTFDIIYSVTAIRTSKHEPAIKYPLDLQASRKLLITSTGCVFIVSAAGPAQPDVRTNVYNGAVCRWDVKEGVGENYYVDYAHL